MWQIHGAEDCVLTWGGLVSRWKYTRLERVEQNENRQQNRQQSRIKLREEELL